MKKTIWIIATTVAILASFVSPPSMACGSGKMKKCHCTEKCHCGSKDECKCNHSPA